MPSFQVIFFAFAIVAAVIRNRQFVEAYTLLEHFGCNLGFKVKTVALDYNLLENLGSKNFVAGFPYR